MVNSKAKGASFEREVCKRLSLWLSDGRSDSLLWRSAMSGGRATIQYRSGKVNLTQSGDVSAVGREAFDFCERHFVEAKHYRDLSIARGFICNTGALRGFWDIAVREADKHGKRPLLIARQNLYPTLVITLADRSGDEPLLFTATPIMHLSVWRAVVYLFDEATAVKRLKMVRRT